MKTLQEDIRTIIREELDLARTSLNALDLKSNSRTVKICSPNKDVLKTLDEVLTHNRKILEMNSMIVETLCNPVIILPGKNP